MTPLRIAGPVDLVATLEGGQAFRWVHDERGFIGVVGERVVCYRPGRAGAVLAESWPRARASWHARYLRCEPADEEARARLRRDPVLAPVIATHPGLRILRQEPWETTVAFLTSANNNVLRIAGIVRGLAAKHGAPLDSPLGPARAFPDAPTLARVSETQLRALGLGYRAPFLRETARMVARGDVDLDALVGAPLSEVREALLTLPGVGPKVADCIALFSLDADDAFPIDRWVLRAVSDVFFEGRATKARDVASFAAGRWGRDAGLAQQFLFHAARVGGLAG